MNDWKSEMLYSLVNPSLLVHFKELLKINLNLYFRSSLFWLKMFYEGL